MLTNFCRWMSVVSLALLGCSLQNREGPDVTCADLANGARNACQEGIIAFCNAGVVAYVACEDSTVCGASWQRPDSFRCSQNESAPTGNGSGVGGSNGSTGSSPSSGPSGPSTCTPGAIEPCVGVSGEGERYCRPDGTWTACLFERFGCIESKSGGWESAPDFEKPCEGQPLLSYETVACKACPGEVVCSGQQGSLCLVPDDFVPPVACGVAGTVVWNPKTVSGQTYCLADGSLYDRANDGLELPPSSTFCGMKTVDDQEPCGTPGVVEQCCDSAVRVCRVTQKWSACFS